MLSPVRTIALRVICSSRAAEAVVVMEVEVVQEVPVEAAGAASITSLSTKKDIRKMRKLSHLIGPSELSLLLVSRNAKMSDDLRLR